MLTLALVGFTLTTTASFESSSAALGGRARTNTSIFTPPATWGPAITNEAHEKHLCSVCGDTRTAYTVRESEGKEN